MNNRFKYPRTYHLPFSEGVQSDDKLIPDLSQFDGKEVVVTLKMDGENTTIYSDGYTHARSIDSKTNWTRDIVKKTTANISHLIPSGYRLCLENVYATHSIIYPDGYLDGYLYLLSIWAEDNNCLSWDDTKEYAELLELPTPKELYRGEFSVDTLKQIANKLDTETEEGFVVRLTSGFGYDSFSKSVTKWVRKGHVQTDVHWLKTAVTNGKPKKGF